MKTTVHLSKAQARRITLAAQGFRAPRHDPPTMRTLTRAVQRTGVLQVGDKSEFYFHFQRTE